MRKPVVAVLNICRLGLNLSFNCYVTTIGVFENFIHQGDVIINKLT